MLSNDQVKAFVEIVQEAYECGEVPDNMDSLSFLLGAFETLNQAVTSQEDGEPILNVFAERYLHLGQS